MLSACYPALAPARQTVKFSIFSCTSPRKTESDRTLSFYAAIVFRTRWPGGTCDGRACRMFAGQKRSLVKKRIKTNVHTKLFQFSINPRLRTMCKIIIAVVLCARGTERREAWWERNEKQFFLFFFLFSFVFRSLPVRGTAEKAHHPPAPNVLPRERISNRIRF